MSLGLSDFSRRLKEQFSSCFALLSSQRALRRVGVEPQGLIAAAPALSSSLSRGAVPHCPHPGLPQVMPWPWRGPRQERAELVVGGIAPALFTLPSGNAGSWVSAPSITYQIFTAGSLGAGGHSRHPNGSCWASPEWHRGEKGSSGSNS